MPSRGDAAARKRAAAPGELPEPLKGQTDVGLSALNAIFIPF
jgi:hypothetical protein